MYLGSAARLCLLTDEVGHTAHSVEAMHLSLVPSLTCSVSQASDSAPTLRPCLDFKPRLEISPI